MSKESSVHAYPQNRDMPVCSAIIKSLNEEAAIGRCIASVVAASRKTPMEIILADSGSSDNTIAIASSYPIRIVQLVNEAERCCGIGPQLGFQHSTAPFIWLIDADMVVDEDFLPEALRTLAGDASLAGVGGTSQEMNNTNFEFRRRSLFVSKNQTSQFIQRLDGGGVYRRDAILDVGYLSDRNLHSYEEFDLGQRLLASGWRLKRIGVHSFDHYGHSISSYKLLWKRFRSLYSLGLGEALRASMLQHRLWSAFMCSRDAQLWMALLLWWMLIIVASGLILSTELLLFGLFLNAMFIAIFAVGLKKSLSEGIYSAVSWHLFSVSMLLGILRPRTDPSKAINSRIISDTDVR